METVSVKTILQKVQKPAEWFGAEFNMNIYRGCTHGCIYCDSRSVCYHNPDFDTVKVKENALEIFRDELRRKIKKGVISTGAMSDPYNPFEIKEKLTRNSLELINAYNFGVAIDTKSDLVTRDIDILTDIKSHSPVIVKITITTADDKLSSIIEPNVASSSKRFETLKTLSDAGIFCGVLMTPLLPFITDTEENITKIILKAKEAGASFIYPAMFGMTLRKGNREYYYQKLDEHFPGIKKKHIARYRNSYVCYSVEIRKLLMLFTDLCNKHGILYDMNSIIHAYRRHYQMHQLGLFETDRS